MKSPSEANSRHTRRLCARTSTVLPFQFAAPRPRFAFAVLFPPTEIFRLHERCQYPRTESKTRGKLPQDDDLFLVLPLPFFLNRMTEIDDDNYSGTPHSLGFEVD